MAIILYTLIAVGMMGTIAVLICLLHEPEFPQLLPIYKPRKKVVGPSFWGIYREGSEPQSIQTIKLPKITFEEQVAAGGMMYAKGRAIKSARSK